MRKRKLTSFKFKGIGLHDDDFVHCQHTAVIHYLLRGQKLRRVWYLKFNDEFLNTLPNPKTLSQFIYHQFKSSLNIKHI